MVNKQKTARAMRQFIPKKAKLATMGGMDLEIPNHSGDNSAGTILKTPVNDIDIPNKAYVDDAIAGIPVVPDYWDRTGTTLSPKTPGDDIETAGDITGERLFVDDVYGNQDTDLRIQEGGSSGIMVRGDFWRDQGILAVRNRVGNQIVFTSVFNVNNDHDHANQANPTMFFHSETDPNTNNTQWGSITHDGTDFLFNAGTGVFNLSALDVTTTGTIKAANYQSGDGSAGITQSETGVTDFDIVIKDGLITSFTKNN